ncbi:MAG: hypothetical protein R3C44_04050 [Chloroflexota bacterium]
MSEDLSVFGHDGSPRYLVLPDSPVAAPVRRAVADAGFQLEPVSIEADSELQMTLYRVEAAVP